MTTYETVVVETQDGVATVTLNRPDRFNSMTPQMVTEVHAALTELADDTSIRVLLLTGEGRGFCPGADMARDTSATSAEDQHGRAATFQVPTLLHEMGAVTVAAVNGACAGAGLGWAAACDLRFAARSARFNTAFLNVAVAGDMGLPWTLPRIVGAAKARELSFLAEKFTAEDAVEMGLVTSVFDDDVFREQVAEKVKQLAERSPEALRTLKLNYVAAERLTLADYVDFETEQHLQLFARPEVQAAFKAFLAR